MGFGKAILANLEKKMKQDMQIYYWNATSYALLDAIIKLFLLGTMVNEIVRGLA